MKDVTAEAFRNVGDMETPLATIRDLVVGLSLIAEALSDDEASAIQRIAWLAKDQCDAVEDLRGNLFRLTHPQREHFEQEGWPS